VENLLKTVLTGGWSFNPTAICRRNLVITSSADLHNRCAKDARDPADAIEELVKEIDELIRPMQSLEAQVQRRR
jgi:hypothetical protein